ncbi:hypothetical protein [Psychrobacter sp.]|uniref:hypothetical protein n=1 Tax=Psychrobacter sp. TaxID=56811 RepID=UPI003BB1826D
MSDKKNNQSADLEANLAKIANAKPRRRNRKDNIYERFITRVESVDIIDSSDDDESDRESIADKSAKQTALKPLKNANKLSSYEPLSAAELELFAIQDEDILQEDSSLQISDYTSTTVSLDFSDENEEEAENLVLTTDIDNSLNDNVLNDNTVHIAKSVDNENLITQSTQHAAVLALEEPINKKNIKSKDKLATSKKPLIIGMIFGSLLIAAIVFTLLFTGVLSTATTSKESDSAGTPASASVTPTLSENNTPVASIEQGVEIDESKPSDASAPNTSNPSTSAPQTAIVNDANKDTASNVDGTNKPAADLNTDPAITYDDFREESQSTLYRETND